VLAYASSCSLPLKRPPTAVANSMIQVSISNLTAFFGIISEAPISRVGLMSLDQPRSSINVRKGPENKEIRF
jgi:hypothetical protein